MPHSRLLLLLAAATLLAASAALAQTQLPRTTTTAPSVPDIVNRAQTGTQVPPRGPAVPPVDRGSPPVQGSDVADTLAKAGVPPTPDTLSGRNEKTADDAAWKVEEASGLPPQLRDLKDQAPPNPKEIIRRLGLHDDPATRVDFRDRTPSAEEIVEALRPR
jgi:hypothetical protein